MLIKGWHRGVWLALTSAYGGQKRKTRESGFSFVLGIRSRKAERLVVERAFVPSFDVLDADD